MNHPTQLLDHLQSVKMDTVNLASQEFGERNDCAVRAISLACNVQYEAAWYVLDQLGRRYGKGTTVNHIRQCIHVLEHEIVNETAPLQPRGTRYTLKTIPTITQYGFYIAFTWNHAAAIIDGRVLDAQAGTHRRVVLLWEIEREG